MTRGRLWWAVHNLCAHPLMELLSWVGQRDLGNWVHDETARRAMAAHSVKH